MQLALIVIAGYSYSNNEDWAEWTMFGVSLAWGLVNPATYESVAAANEQRAQEEEQKQQGEDVSTKKKAAKMGWLGACASVFTRHFTRTPLLFVLATLFAIGQAILGTYQGAVINELTKAVTKGVPEEDTVEQLAGTLIVVWFCASLCRFIFDTLSAIMFTKLDIWLRGTVFDKAVNSTEKNNDEDSENTLSMADYQARYASDITGVVGLYGTLLRGVVVNVLMICTNFIFLAITEWRIATVTLGFLAMGVTSGPTDLAGTAARNVQNDVTKGLSILQESEPAQAKVERHETEVLVPLKRDVFGKFFFSNMVDTFNNFFSSFLTAIVVISMSWEVFYGNMDSSEFLGTFFVFKQLQKPATKLSGVIKKAVSKTANLERVNAVVFDDNPEKDPGDDTEHGNEEDEQGDAEEKPREEQARQSSMKELKQSVVMQEKDPNLDYLETESLTT